MAPLKNVFTEGKLRASWGKLGNQNIGIYPSVAALDMGSHTLGGRIVNTAALNDLANKDISWETTEEKNLGIDLSFFNRSEVRSVGKEGVSTFRSWCVREP